MVGGNGVHHPIALAQALADVGADDRMRALHLVVDGLADVMQQAGLARHLDACAHLGRHRGAQVRHLHRVGQHVLAVAGAELEAAQ